MLVNAGRLIASNRFLAGAPTSVGRRCGVKVVFSYLFRLACQLITTVIGTFIV
jgi:hypothetical protein